MRYFIAITTALLLSVTAEASSKFSKSIDLCKTASHAAERKYGIPQNLLRAISLTESGRWNEKDKANIAWPWTVASGKAGEFFPTKSEAIRYVKSLQAKGIKNIDVGCMQINLRYHPEAFNNLNEAFDPYKNTNYAGDFLSRLFKETKSWTAAAGRYHSSEPTKNMYYREKVLSYWNYANKDAHEERQLIAKANKPKRTVAVRDNQRVAMLNDSFRKRMDKQRKALNRAAQLSSQFEKYRDSRFGQANRARTAALTRKKQKKLLTIPPKRTVTYNQRDFSQRRSAQLDKWRKTVANPEMLNKAPSKTTKPQTLLNQ